MPTLIAAALTATITSVQKRRVVVIAQIASYIIWLTHGLLVCVCVCVCGFLAASVAPWHFILCDGDG